MKTIMQCALLSVAMLAAAPAMAQSTVGGQGGEASVGGQGNGGGNGGGFGGGGNPGGGGNGRLERLNAVCVAAQCGPQRPRRPHISLNRAVVGDLCGQQLTFGRDAIFYYERCDSRM